MSVNGNAPLLAVESLNVYYGGIHALHDVSFAIQAGEIATLIGANGAGKSSTLRSISGLVPAAPGSRIVFDGQDITRWPPHQIVAAGISQSPEGRRIFAAMSVDENLQLGAFARGRARREDLDRVYQLFPRLAERRYQSGGTLSGGEQQMLAIGRALMARPRLLLLDEPSLGLAPLLVREIFRIIADIQATAGVTILLVEQNAQMALATASRGYVLETGRVILSDACANLAANDEVRKAYLGE
ncbi:MAG: ABC transporter ATP-binding protein [Fimbriimonadaceae bacterium]|nr:ABC transporter ATP-binding protein [Fimbriimonadaceae bacterium]